MTDLSIIIVCYKGWDRLHKCLDALDSFTGRNISTEVIVVDNRSGDEEIYRTEKKYHRFRFIYNTVNGGFANGSNLGASRASGEFIMFLNPDTVVTETAVEKLVDISRKNNDFSIISCKQINERGKESIAYGQFPSLLNLTGFQRAIFRSNFKEISDNSNSIFFPDWVSGSLILIKKVLLNKTGGFDEHFWMYFEDVDLCKRAHDSGGKIAFCRDIIIEHNHGGSSRINLKTTTLTKTEVRISQHYYISKNTSGIKKFLIQSFLVINNLISGGIMAVIGLVLFFIPKIFSRALIYFNLLRYYTGSLRRLTWVSPRSVMFQKN
jgi:GT2 family glycosyltransferase